LQKKTKFPELTSPSYWERLFTGRISRINYLVGFFISYLTIPVFVAITVPLFAFTPLRFVSNILIFVLWAGSVTYGSSFIVRRFRDLGKSWQWALWLLVPFVNIYFIIILFFKKGEEEINEYGNVPDGGVNVRTLFGLE